MIYEFGMKDQDGRPIVVDTESAEVQRRVGWVADMAGLPSPTIRESINISPGATPDGQIATTTSQEAQPQQLPAKPAAPATVTIRVVVDGVATKHELKPGAIEVLNNFLHAQGYKGTFADRYITWLRAALKDLSRREEFAPTDMKTEMDALKAAQEAIAADADSVGEERK